MKRRAMLAGGSALAFGSAGCSLLRGDGSRQFRLWFVRVLNDLHGDVAVGLGVTDGSRTVTERRYEPLPGRRVDESPGEATFACEPNIRLLRGDWSGTRGDFGVEYSIGEAESWESLAFDRPAENLAIDLHVLPGRRPPGTAHQVLGFESREQAAGLLDDVTAECDGGSTD